MSVRDSSRWPWRPRTSRAIAAGRPELICVALTGEAVLADRSRARRRRRHRSGTRAHAWARSALQVVLGAGKPLVVDADALNLLAENGPAAA